MQIKNGINKRYVLLFPYLIILFILSVTSSSADTDGIINILQPQLNSNPRNLMFFTDQSGANNVLFQYQFESVPNKINFIKSRNNIWSAPVYLNLETWSNVQLCDVRNINDNTPLMLLLGDNTDYTRILDVAAIKSGENIPALLNITEEEFHKMLLSNQRLFISFSVNGQWVEPVVIPGTYGAAKAAMAAGSDGSVLVVYYKNPDGKLETSGDIDLYATVYTKGLWSECIRITNNDKADYGAQVVFIRDEYLIVWGSDEDNNFATNNDRLLNYTVIGNDGKVIVNSMAVMNQFQTNPLPVLGKYDDKAVLIWSSEAISEADPRRPLWEMVYENNWTTPRKTGLFNYQMETGSLHEIRNSLVLIYQDTGTLQAAVREGDAWFTSGTLINLNLLTLDASAVSYCSDQNGNVHIGLTGFVPAKEKNYDNEFDGIYYTKRSLLTDLSLSNINTSPRKKKIGQDIELEFSVYNAGFLKSAKYSVLIKENNVLLKKLEGEGIVAGEEQAFKFTTKMDKATKNLELEIVCESDESSKENNKLPFPVKSLPDYSVQSVSRKDSRRIAARIIENKNIAAPPVAVDFYAVINGESQKIGSSTYDPIADESVEISWQNLNSISGAFQLIAEVNHERTIQEDDYANNKGSFIFDPLPDFTLENFTTSKDAISVTITNNGELDAAKIDILITDDPVAAAAQDINAVMGNLHYYQEIALDENQTAKVTINYNKLNELVDKRIYAIVNPNGVTYESDQNNNQATTLVKLRASLPTDKRQLIFGAVYGAGSGITVTLVNTGDNAALTPRVELVNNAGIIVNQQIVPVVKAHGWNKLVFSNIKSGKYTIRLVTNWTGNVPDILETSVSL